jgi:ribosome-associated protein
VADPSERWAILAAQAASSKKGTDPVVLAVGDVLSITDFFVIVSGTNPRQVRTIADEVEEQVRDAGGPSPLRVEGLDDLHWVLVDYGEFVVHVFLQETREYYELERLWADVPAVEWEESTVGG